METSTFHAKQIALTGSVPTASCWCGTMDLRFNHANAPSVAAPLRSWFLPNKTPRRTARNLKSLTFSPKFKPTIASSVPVPLVPFKECWISLFCCEGLLGNSWTLRDHFLLSSELVFILQ
uniref:Uncharacterized protein n=1 Tax=Lotus japonicus TaxID=34305 RepID=I3S573_LOTJA|nr:unknown [Lotus japonicus]